MSPRTFKTKIENCDIVFTVKKLSHRDLQKVLELNKRIKESGKELDFEALQEAIETCVVGWSLKEPISEITAYLDVAEEMEIIANTLRGISISEDELKKSE